MDNESPKQQTLPQLISNNDNNKRETKWNKWINLFRSSREDMNNIFLRLFVSCSGIEIIIQSDIKLNTIKPRFTCNNLQNNTKLDDNNNEINIA